jgi:hypothetical protein
MVPIPVARAGWMTLALLLMATPLLAVTRWKAIEPGTSTRDQVDTALGQPQRNISAMLYEYAPQQGTGRVLVEYRPNGVVHRVQVELVKPVSRAALIKQFQLEEFTPLRKFEPDGSLAEYFGSNASLVFVYVGKDDSTGVARIGFYSGELFDQVTGPLMASLPASGSTPTTPVTDATLIIETLNPAECQDVYVWADAEQPNARRSRNAGRRQLLLDILIASQKGDCARARTQAAAYKSAYPK